MVAALRPYDTIGRYGVIDRRMVGANGWRTGFACLHEQWFSQIGIALADGDYIANCTATYDYERQHAIQPDGRVKSRWCYSSGDAMPGTYDPFGFYEAQWGYLMDSQPAFAICVAEQFDLTGDEGWLRDQKTACERALEYLLRRASDRFFEGTWSIGVNPHSVIISKSPSPRMRPCCSCQKAS